MNEEKQKRLQELGVDTEELLARFMGNEALMTRFLGKFPQDENFGRLEQALEAGDAAGAYAAAHTLKGVCHCLGMTRLYDSSYALTEVLRAGLPHDGALLNRVHQDYETVIRAVHGLGGGR